MTSRHDRFNGIEALINRRQLRQQIPASDMSIWRWEQQGKFPKHISINGRNYWRASEISDWLDEQAGASSKAEGRS